MFHKGTKTANKVFGLGLKDLKRTQNVEKNQRLQMWVVLLKASAFVCFALWNILWWRSGETVARANTGQTTSCFGLCHWKLITKSFKALIPVAPWVVLSLHSITVIACLVTAHNNRAVLQVYLVCRVMSPCVRHKNRKSSVCLSHCHCATIALQPCPGSVLGVRNRPDRDVPVDGVDSVVNHHQLRGKLCDS